MVAYKLQTEVFLELLFNVSGETNEQIILKKNIPLYLKKLNCFFAGVLKNTSEGQEEKMLTPYAESKSDDWPEIKKYFASIKTKNHEPCLRYIHKGFHYYAFCLNSYGTLILGRTQEFETMFMHELGPVVNHLGKALLQATEIERRRKAEKDLAESEEKFRTIFNESPVGIELYGADGMQLDANKASLQMFGIPDISEIKKFNLFEGTSLDAEKKEKLHQGEPITYQAAFDFEKVKTLNQYQTDRLGLGNFEYIITPLFDESRKSIKGYLLQVQEITERKRSEQIQKVLYNISNAVITTDNLEQLIGRIREELGMVIDTSNFYVALYDDKTDTLSLPFFADEKDKITTFPAGKTCTKYVIKTRKSLLADKNRVKELEKSDEIEIIGTGSEIWLGVPLFTEGKVIGVLAVQSYTNEKAYTESDMKMLEFISGQISNYIDRRKAEEELIKAKEAIEISEKQFKTMFDNAPIGIALVDSITAQIYQANPKHASIVGRTVEEITKIDWKSFTHPDDIEPNLKNLKQMLEGKIQRFEMEKRMFQKNGKMVWVNLFVEPIRGFNRANPCHLTMMEDITEKKKITDDLIAAKEKAEESDRLKSAFLANMSHEIRTPMNGILGFAELLKEPQLSDKEQQKYVGIIEKSGERMLNIINDIINISKVESGQMEISISETNLNEQLEYIYTFFKPETKQKGIHLKLKKTLPDREALIETDREKVYAILTNLVKNAIKFTDSGSIEIGYDLRSAKQQAELKFYVMDTGMGIRDEQKLTIFERFRQGSESLTRNYEGSGLGLAISKAYIEMLGGQIWVENNHQKGSIFYFTLPYNAPVGNSSTTIDLPVYGTDTNQIKGLKILIVDDDKTSEILLTKVLQTIGDTILKVETGLDAIEACLKNRDIDLIMMDIKMPVMDGYEATRQIREFNDKVVIIAQTAYALPGDREKAIEAGCNDYVSKPIEKKKLMALLKQYFQV